jgi:DNA helicase HerA-like ATPase
VIILELARRSVPVLILDRTGEYHAAMGGSQRVTYLQPGENLTIPLFRLIEGKDSERQVEEWISLLEHFWRVSYNAEMSPLQARIVREVLREHYRGTKETFTISRLVEKLVRLEKEAQGLSGWAESIEAVISRLYQLTVEKVGDTFDRSYETFEVSKIFEQGITILDLSKLWDDRAKNLLSQIVLKMVYDATREMTMTSAVRLVVIVDEAQHLAPRDRRYTSIPELCAIELRKYGLGLVMIASRPTFLSENIIANSNTVICHMINNHDDIETGLGYFNWSRSSDYLRDRLRGLSVGYGFLRVNHPAPSKPLYCTVAYVP